MMVGKWPAVVVSYDANSRRARVKIDGVTDGCEIYPEAEFEYPFGDKSKHTEIRVLTGDDVGVEFQRGDSRYPIITGYRPKHTGNAIDWRRWHHANFETTADGEIILEAGSKITLKVGGTSIVLTAAALLNTVAQTTMTGATTSQGAFAFQSGMTGQGGAGGGTAMTINGGAEFTEDVTAAGTSVHGHRHKEHDGPQTDAPS